MERFILFTVNGFAFGAIYASVALALVIIWRATRVLNFAQGAQAVASAYVAWSVTDATGSFWLGVLAALVSGLVIGALVQLTVFRKAESMPHLNAVIVGVGLLILIQAVLGMAYSVETTRTIDAAFSSSKWQVAGTPLVSPQDVFVLGSVLLVMAGIGYLMAKTPVGLRMRAAAFAPDTARLMGVKVSRMLTLGWAVAGLAGAVAAILVVPTSAELTPQVMDGVFVLGFTAAVVGGLDSLVGAVVGGLGVGLVLSYTSGYLSSDLLYPAALVLLIVILLVKPEGLFSAAQARRV
ncbi:branched-chain amino acid ABC transporter permease [Nocardioides albidus]|uniref:Branched-chain amino acid ABC transporter permease n=1 Tax=Nocardioides albidus TaxID=1517589 RepID=A0A5C4VM19_9ACTN|nr:branched-chain amino acid ABC transporter permease [Nocardioides albidus]TNM36496.1 branched-chain amino acid ABC transporter permease [Nocardioides albidus]